MKKYSISLFFLATLLLGCSRSFETDVTIIGCQTITGDDMSIPVGITVNNTTKIWEPGVNLEFTTDIGGDIGTVLLQAEVNGYEYVSPQTFNVDLDKGLELVLMFRELNENSVTDTQNPGLVNQGDENNGKTTEEEAQKDGDDISEEQTVSNGQLTITTRTDGVTFYIDSQDTSASESLIALQIDESDQISLPLGQYNWTAQKKGFNTINREVTIVEDETSILTINLEENISNSTLEFLTTPNDAQVILINSSNDNRVMSNQDYVYSVKPGNYRYEISKNGYETIKKPIIISPGENIQINEELSALRIEEIMSRIDDISSLSDAISIYQELPESAPVMNLEQRTEYLSNLYSLGVILEEGGESDRASQVFQHILQINPRYIEARFSLADNQRLRKSFDRAIETLRPILGSISNDLPRTERRIARLETRWRVAQTYFDQYQSTSENNINELQSVGFRTRNSLRDFIDRYESANGPGDLKDEYDSALDMIDIIESDLGI